MRNLSSERNPQEGKNQYRPPPNPRSPKSKNRFQEIPLPPVALHNLLLHLATVSFFVDWDGESGKELRDLSFEKVMVSPDLSQISLIKPEFPGIGDENTSLGVSLWWYYIKRRKKQFPWGRWRRSVCVWMGLSCRSRWKSFERYDFDFKGVPLWGFPFFFFTIGWGVLVMPHSPHCPAGVFSLFLQIWFPYSLSLPLCCMDPIGKAKETKNLVEEDPIPPQPTPRKGPNSRKGLMTDTRKKKAEDATTLQDAQDKQLPLHLTSRKGSKELIKYQKTKLVGNPNDGGENSTTPSTEDLNTLELAAIRVKIYLIGYALIEQLLFIYYNIPNDAKLGSKVPCIMKSLPCISGEVGNRWDYDDELEKNNCYELFNECSFDKQSWLCNSGAPLTVSFNIILNKPNQLPEMSHSPIGAPRVSSTKKLGFERLVAKIFSFDPRLYKEGICVGHKTPLQLKGDSQGNQNCLGDSCLEAIYHLNCRMVMSKNICIKIVLYANFDHQLENMCTKFGLYQAISLVYPTKTIGVVGFLLY